MKKQLIGHVAVDSGQLLLCDPCYIDSEWEKEKFEDVRIYKHKDTGALLQYKVDFPHYEAVIPLYGLNMNQLLSTGEWIDQPSGDSKHGFSYNACCKATLSKERHGQMRFKMGNVGAGVAFSTAFGDGMYPVYATYDKEGFVKSVTVELQ